MKTCRDGSATTVVLLKRVCGRACRSPSHRRETQDGLKDGGREVDLKELMMHRGG